MEIGNKIKEAMTEIQDTVNNGKDKTLEHTCKELAPSGMAWFRAGISLIPIAGGALDHLLFDKYSAIQQKNMQQAIDAMKEKMASLDEQKVSKVWFESEEALDMFKNLCQRVMYEGDSAKIKMLSNVFCLFGTNEHQADPNKYAVLDTLSKLTNNQRVFFKALYEMEQVKKTVGNNIMFTVVARWQSSILDYCNSHPEILSQLKKPASLHIDLNILASFSLIENMGIPINEDVAYRLSSLGMLAYSYMKDA